MKVIVITMYQGNNYGGALQVFATQKILESMNHEVEIINYTPWRLKEENIVREGVKLNPMLTHNILLGTIYRLSAFLSRRRNRKVFNGFYSAMLNLTRPYEGEELYKECPEGDIYMTGSDQVWCNKEEYKKLDKIYYLDFVSKEKRKISYASSIGKDRLSEWEIPQLKNLLKSYSKVSVREDVGVRLLEDIGIKNVKHVLDPTLLINKEIWKKYIIKPKRKINKNYVLVYELGINSNTTRLAYRIARDHELKVIQVSPALYAIAKKGEFVFCPEVFEFLWLLDNAEFVITDSFHGVAFSINFNKQFFVAAPMHNSSRIESMLRLTNLQERKIVEKVDYNIKIDYAAVNSKLEKAREDSINYLKGALKEVSHD